VCRYGTMTFAKWIMGAFDKKLLDFQSAILEAAKKAIILLKKKMH
jgi:hypothetical protein